MGLLESTAKEYTIKGVFYGENHTRFSFFESKSVRFINKNLQNVKPELKMGEKIKAGTVTVFTGECANRNLKWLRFIKRDHGPTIYHDDDFGVKSFIDRIHIEDIGCGYRSPYNIHCVYIRLLSNISKRKLTLRKDFGSLDERTNFLLQFKPGVCVNIEYESDRAAFNNMKIKNIQLTKEVLKNGIDLGLSKSILLIKEALSSSKTLPYLPKELIALILQNIHFLEAGFFIKTFFDQTIETTEAKDPWSK